jgi:hypothetical protein
MNKSPIKWNYKGDMGITAKINKAASLYFYQLDLILFWRMGPRAMAATPICSIVLFIFVAISHRLGLCLFLTPIKAAQIDRRRFW